MKKLKKKLSLVLALTFLVALLMPTTAMAGTKVLEATSTAQKQTVTSTENWYKLVSPGEGYYTFSVPTGYEGDYDVYNSSKTSTIKSFWQSTSTSYRVVKVPVSKETIYVRASWLSSSTKNAFTYKYTPITQKTNYCRGKAYTLTRDKATLCYQTPLYNYARWFKFTTTGTQEIRIYALNTGSLSLYDSKGNTINLNYDSGLSEKSSYSVYRTISVGKGTYYLRAGYYSDFSDRRIMQLKWH